jgi:hypothetical protein
MTVDAEWKVYYPGQKVICPGRTIADRRGDQRDGDRRHPCQRVFVRVGQGEIYRIRWLGDRETPAPEHSTATSHRCRDCGAVFEVKVEHINSKSA